MNLFGWELSRKSNDISLDTLIRRLEAIHDTVSGINVTPDTAMQSPTVQAIVTAISRRIATLPVHVLKRTVVNGRTRKERVPSHPVERLLNRPNDWQDRVSYWLDATSWLVRYGRYYAYKSRGVTGPIRRLEPLHPSSVQIEQDDNMAVRILVTTNGGQKSYAPNQIHHARGPARNGLEGDSPVMDMREAIALEIAAEKFGASFFGNGAMPLIIFQYMQGSQGHKTDEERNRFVEDFQAAYRGQKRFRAMLMPKGIEAGKPIPVENDKAQFLETRKYQRTVIAGAWGVPPHMVGDLERGTFNNVEQQSLGFVMDVVLPYIRIFEAAMERDLLTDEDRNSGVIIRFNLDGALRADFKTRQEGLKIQREAGVISPNDWREMEGMNPIDEEDGGDTYWQQGPSGQGSTPTPDKPDPEDEDADKNA